MAYKTCFVRHQEKFVIVLKIKWLQKIGVKKHVFWWGFWKKYYVDFYHYQNYIVPTLRVGMLLVMLQRNATQERGNDENIQEQVRRVDSRSNPPFWSHGVELGMVVCLSAKPPYKSNTLRVTNQTPYELLVMFQRHATQELGNGENIQEQVRRVDSRSNPPFWSHGVVLGAVVCLSAKPPYKSHTLRVNWFRSCWACRSMNGIN